ncbi:MAG: amidohydrolase family protein [Planctomycetes bacterium]|nr:amidohydrolase family protein [Planctomycetota bacterium]
MTRWLILAALLLQDADVELDADRVPKTRTRGNVLVRNGTIHTVSARGTIRGDILVKDGRIAAIGTELKAPEGVAVIDATGLHVMPGIIDCHSHLATDGGLNESSQSVTPEVRIADILDPRDVGIYRAVAGGCTTGNVLHGSANTIGGQNAVIKHRWGKDAKGLLFAGAPRGVKFALGENVTQANFPSNRGKRFPNTRLGVEATLRRAFAEAQEYMKRGAGARRDLRLEALADILRGDILVHCHCYRADEILMILRLAKEFGFRLATLQHALEAYKVAPEIAEAGVGVSTFADWWAYKVEAYDAVPHNAALCTRAGAVVSINSDSANHIRRLNLEAAKAMKYGGLTEDEAMRLVTINPARQLRIDSRVGSIEVGKDADLAIFRGHPLSMSSRCVTTLIDGEVFFERREDSGEAPPFARSTATLRERSRGREGAFVFVNATVHPVSAPDFVGSVVVRNGRIEKMGPKLAPPPDATVYDASGLHLYPGLIDCETSLGLVEIEAVAGTTDDREIGNVQPDLVALGATNAQSEHIAVARANGITTALVVPSGGLVSGQSSYVRLEGWTPREMGIRETVALHLRMPSIPEEEEPKEEDKQLKELRELFQAARRYAKTPRDLRLEALQPYVRGERPVVIEAGTPLQIRTALRFAAEFGLRPVVSGGAEAWKVAPLLAEKKVPVILSTLRLPARRHDPYDSAYFAPARLHKAGVPFAIRTDSSSDVRNLPYQAAMAAAYGLPRDEALKAITLHPARIFGLERGTLEEGRPADLIVTNGDPLEIATDVLLVMIDGKRVPLESRHTRLYEKFRARIK